MRFNASAWPIAAVLALAAGCKDAGDASPTRTGGSAAEGAGRRSDPLGAARSTQDKSAQDRTGMGSSTATRTGDTATRTGDTAAGAAGEQKSVTGTVAQASPDEVRVDTANQPGIKLKVNNSTRITVDGKDASVSELREGTQVRASYQGSGDQATAVRIEARSGKTGSDGQLPGMRGRSNATGIPSSTSSGSDSSSSAKTPDK
jgi:hypothetical protein